MSLETAVNLLTLNKEPYTTRRLSLIPAIKSNSQDTKKASKQLLKSALQKANIAVQCDSTNDVLGAINAYKEAISLLETVLSNVRKENDKRRLQSIHDSYSERVRLLNNISSKFNREKGIDLLTKRSNAELDHTNSKLSLVANTSNIRRVPSKSSIQNNLLPPIKLDYWQDNYGWPVSQKEIPKYPVLPPAFYLQASKSTPTHSHHLKQKPLLQRKVHLVELDEENITKNYKDKYSLRPHEYLLQKHDALEATPDSITKKSNRLSFCSINSMISSVGSVIEQPTMVLPSLNRENEEIAPKIKATFRLSNSSLYLIHRSSSMTNVEAIMSQEDQDLESEKPTCTPSQIYPPQMIINRPIVSRPVVGGLGSMRRKAAHRLSMDSFTLGRNKIALSLSVGNDTYDFFLKNQMDNLNTDTMPDENQSHHNGTFRYLKLLFALEKSIIEGAHITEKLYIPRNLWRQPNIRLQSMDVKIAACETLIQEIDKLENWYLEDSESLLMIFNHLEATVDYIRISLSKKLKRDNTSSLDSVQNNDTSSFNTVENKKTSFISLGAKFTKSVEKMNAFSLLKTEDQYQNYIDTLQRFFLKIHILERWLNYHQSRQQQSKQQNALISQLIKICAVINDVMGGFIVNDVTLLLAKWLKRGGSWVYE